MVRLKNPQGSKGISATKAGKERRLAKDGRKIKQEKLLRNESLMIVMHRAKGAIILWMTYQGKVRLFFINQTVIR
jgi:hypothetical protein